MILFVTHSIEEAIRVGNRILLLSAYPGTVKAEIRSSGIDQTDRTGRLLSSRIHEELSSDVRDKPVQGDAVRMSSIVAVLVAAALGYGGAQWLNSREGKIRRGPDGQPDLSAPAPRLNGKPNLSGRWEAERTPTSEFVRVMGPGLPAIQPDLNDVTKHVINVFWDVKPTELPLRPEAVALTEQRQKSGRDFQTAYCLPSGLPAATLVLTVKMIQSPDEIVVLHGNGDPARQIYIDGRTLPEHPEPSWMGTSAGHWQDDTLVVETTGFQERAWLDAFGHPRSETMRITERYRRRDVGHMDLEMTFDDPKYYTKPFGFKTTLNLLPDGHMLEYVCMENQKFRDVVSK